MLRSISWVVAVILVTVVPATAAPFQNLDFEDGTPGAYAFSEAIPGWSPTSFYSGVFFNTVTLDGPGIGIHDRQSWYLSPLHGNYSLVLCDPSVAGLNGAPLPYGVSIAQTGTVPTNAGTLSFLTQYMESNWDAYHLVVSVNGTEVPIGSVGISEWDWLYGYQIVPSGTPAVDLGAYRGQTITLQFELRLFDAAGYTRWMALDDLRFSDLPVVYTPEPASGILLAIAMVGLAAHLLRRKQG